MKDFIMLPIFYHTNESSRNEDLSNELGIEIKPSIEDYEVRLTRVNIDAIEFYYPMNFLDTMSCGMSIGGVDVTLPLQPEQVDELFTRHRLASQPSGDNTAKRSFWRSVGAGLVGLATKIATKRATKMIAVLLFCTSLHAQGDCPAVCVTEGSTYTAVDGLTPELSAANRGCLSAGEATSSFWFRITFTSNGVFLMTITPAGNKNDFDFAIWSGTNCPPTVPPIRCSWAGIFPFGGAANSPTGLAAGNVDVSEAAAGNGFLAPLNVVAGQSIVININNYGNGSDDFTVTYAGTTATMFCGTPLGDELKISVTSSLCGYDIVNSDGTYVEVSYNMQDFEKVNGNRLETSEQKAFFRLMSVNQDGEQVVISYAYCELYCSVFVVSVTDLQGRAVDGYYVGVKVFRYSDGSVRILL